MSTNAASDPVPSSNTASKSSKQGKKKKSSKVNGSRSGASERREADSSNRSDDDVDSDIEDSQKSPSNDQRQVNGTHDDDTDSSEEPATGDATERLNALAKERDTLRAEVTQLRKSLEEVNEKHSEEVGTLNEKVKESQSGKEHAESQYKTLLGRVNTIRSQLGDRLKQDAEQLSEARGQIEELQNENRELKESNETIRGDLDKLEDEHKKQADEVENLRGRANVSQQNWVKERDELITREAYAREEFENAKQAMQDWEVLAMEERSTRENLSERLSELEDRLSGQTEAYERVVTERDTLSTTVDGLQRALQDIQDARKKELREMVGNSQAQLEELKKQLKEAEESAEKSQTSLEATQKELERALPFEKEVREKNLLIGTLRREAVILNDHLTKALRFLKKGKPEDNVDRQIVTNHFLQFLALDRSDPKKFQILQLIAALLGWSEEQREQAGLARPGASNSNLRVPMSPFRRTPSTPSLNTDLMNDAGHGKETLAELWSDFLERESQDVGGSPRRGSAMSPPGSGTQSGPASGLGLSGLRKDSNSKSTPELG